MALPDEFLDWMDDVREWEESGGFDEWLADVRENGSDQLNERLHEMGL